MDAELIIAAEIKKEYDLHNPDWNGLIYTLTAIPSISPAYQMEHQIWNKEHDKIEGKIAWLNDIEEIWQQFFKESNAHQKVNKISFTFKEKECVETAKSWDQTVQDEFEFNLPQSKKGKIKAWYLSDSQSGFPVVNFKEMLKKHLCKMAVIEPAVTLQDVKDKSFEELISLFRVYVDEKDNPLWDGGIIGLKRESNDIYSGKIIQQYAETEEDRMNGYATSEDHTLDKVTDSMKVIYEAVKEAVQRQNPAVQWDTVLVSVYRDGFVEANFELNNEEVELD